MANLKYKDGEAWISISAMRGPKGDNADITLNGQTSQNVSFYAPTVSGNIGQFLSAKGDGQSPEWKDLSLPVVGNGTLTIQKNGSSIGTFTANSSSNQTVNVTVPTNQNIIDLVYPIGSIYMSINTTDPTTLFGGQWERLKDKFLLGSGDTYTNGASGGAATVALGVNHMPSHTHSFTGSSSTTASQSTSTTSTTSISHSHSIPALSGTAASSGAHTHSIPNGSSPQSSGSPPKFESWPTCAGSVRSHNTASAGAHTHSVSTNASTTGSNNPSHSHTFGHTHTVTAAGSNSNTGGGAAHDNMPPYLVVTMWKRIG